MFKLIIGSILVVISLSIPAHGGLLDDLVSANNDTNTTDNSITTGDIKAKKVSIDNSITKDNSVKQSVKVVQGIQGPRGVQGLMGPQGNDGPAGPMGPEGRPGVQGVPGIPGQTGSTGAIGPRGIQGLRGETGPQGIQGIRGNDGEMGPRGLKGEVGDTGARGPAGRLGEKGDKGEKGEKGDRGEPGAVGPAGSTGPQGEQGIQGERGVPGETGPAGSTGPAGERGPTGLTGNTGDQGAQGIQGIQGERGYTGETGATGIQGVRGETGATGPAGETGATGAQGLQGITGSTGAIGQTGPQGIQGTKGDTGLTGATGAIGERGPKGDKGDRGLQGLRGETGATGARGPIGATGPKGDTGDTGATGDSGALNFQCNTDESIVYKDGSWKCGSSMGESSFAYFYIQENGTARIETRYTTVDTSQNEKFVFTVNKIGLYNLGVQMNLISNANSKWFRLSGQTGVLVNETLTFRGSEAPYRWQGQYNIVLPVTVIGQTFTIEMQDGVNLKYGTSVLLKAVSELSGLTISDANMNYTTMVDDNGTVQNINANGATLESLGCNTQQIPIYTDGVWKCVYNTNAFCRLQAKTDNPPAVTYDIINGCNSTFYKFDADKIKVEHGANWFISGNFNIAPNADGDVTVELYKNGYLADKSIIYGYQGKTINLGVSTSMYMLNDHYFSIKVINGLLIGGSSFVHLHRLSAFNYFN